MPRGQSGHTRIGTFACHTFTATPKQAKEPTFPPATERRISNGRLSDFNILQGDNVSTYPTNWIEEILSFHEHGEVFSTRTLENEKGQISPCGTFCRRGQVFISVDCNEHTYAKYLGSAFKC